MQHSEADDFVLATGRLMSVREFLVLAFGFLNINIEFEGKGVEEVGICSKTRKVLVRIDPDYFRPAEVDLLVGDASKAKNLLGWEAKITVEELCREMVYADFYRAKTDLELQKTAMSPPPEAVILTEAFTNWQERQPVRHILDFINGKGDIEKSNAEFL